MKIQTVINCIQIAWEEKEEIKKLQHCNVVLTDDVGLCSVGVDAVVDTGVFAGVLAVVLLVCLLVCLLVS